MYTLSRVVPRADSAGFPPTPVLTKICFLACSLLVSLHGASTASSDRAAGSSSATPHAADDPVALLVGRLNLEGYKDTIKGLTRFGDRQEGTDRNRAALDWIEAQLKSYGYATTERQKYDYMPADPRKARGTSAAGRSQPTAPPASTARIRGVRVPTGARAKALAPPDPRLVALNAQKSVPGPREQIFCTKIGASRPDEMYIVSAHMDGRGGGEAANDDGSGTALVMELARIFGSPEVKTERSIRFVLWNNEETGVNGAQAYVEQRAALQGREDPPGSGRFPEPKWLGMIQHDMMLYDHGMPRADGTVSAEQRPEADVNIEFPAKAKFGREAQQLAWLLYAANEKYATDYPAAVGPHMSNTDSVPFQDLIPAVSLRENERLREIGAGWNPHYHQATDVFSAYSDKDFRLGLNAAQTTLSAVALLADATLQH